MGDDFSIRCRRAAIWGSISGAVIGLAMCIAFGVLDVQCRNDPHGPFWNADDQRCQAHEAQP
jgi:hypothetical protein